MEGKYASIYFTKIFTSYLSSQYFYRFICRAETVRSALDVISVCCVAPRAQLLLCEKVDMPEEGVTVGLNIVLGAAEGEIVADADVQKAALNVLVNCICAPVQRVRTRFLCVYMFLSCACFILVIF